MTEAILSGLRVNPVPGGADGSVVIRMPATVAIPEARELEAHALEAVRAGHRRIAVDLSQVTAIRAGLIGAVLRVGRGLARVDGELTLIVDGPPASQVVNTAGLDVIARVVGALPSTRAR